MSKRSSIALSFLERFRVSDPPVYNLLEQNSLLSVTLKGFTISNPPNQNTGHKGLSIILQEFRISDPQKILLPSPQLIRAKQSSIYTSMGSEILIPIASRDKNGYQFMVLKVFRIFDPLTKVT